MVISWSIARFFNFFVTNSNSLHFLFCVVFLKNDFNLFSRSPTPKSKRKSKDKKRKR